KTRSSRLPRVVTPHGTDQVGEAVLAQGAVARPRSPVTWCSTATSPPSTSTTAPASSASTRSPRRTATRSQAGTSTRSTVGGTTVVGTAAVVVVDEVVVVSPSPSSPSPPSSGSAGAGATSPVRTVIVAVRASSVGLAISTTWSAEPPSRAVPPAQNQGALSVASGRAVGMATPGTTGVTSSTGSSASPASNTSPAAIAPARTTSDVR